MKGTLSSTRIRPQTYSIRGAGRPAFAPRVSPCVYCTYSVRDSAPNSMPYFWPMPPFGNARRLRTPTSRPRSHPLTPESCSARIRPMAKARKPASGSTRHSKGKARSQSKSQKKKTFPPPPPAQRGGVELVDPRVQAQLKVYDEALALFHQQKFARAKQELEKVLEGPSKELADRARMHVKIAEQRMKPSHEQNPRTAEEHYQRGVAMMNIGRWDDARESLDKARKAAPKADHIHYALAALDCLTGEADSALANLKVAIQLRPENRYHARNDEDFAFLQEDPRFTELLYPEKDGTAG
ncbi:MAG: hypothetical protein DMG49_12920 [Acidobacteria bacterium]|nr:MAG: hypothetical protein DMG49_12920 [Acidobacteriota bacterium]